MTNLVVCCDGTWNTPKQEDNGRPAPTNVFKLHAAIDEPKDNKRYLEGVGTSGRVWAKVTGGALGVGLSDDIKTAYKWLCESYVPGESRIFLFGFSRGAFAVRSLAGLIGAAGLLDFSAGPTEAEKRDHVEAAFQSYRDRGKTQAPAPRHLEIEIAFLGVWDTVGALGIPDELFFVNAFDRPGKFQFHDTTLGGSVRVARHVLAMDERRQAFSPTLWTGATEAGQDVKQEWFCGSHGDVGGSYAETGLGDVTLAWMIAEAEAQGLKFKPLAKAQIDPNPRGVLHNSVKGVYKRFRTRPRSVPDVSRNEVNGSARQRAADPPLAQPDYWPTRRLQPGESQSLDVFAGERWTRTGLYLEQDGTYRFVATGEWFDGKIVCTPDGPVPGFNLAKALYGASAVPELLQGRKRRRTKNKGVTTRGARREQDMPWMSLVGVIANGSGVDEDSQILNPHETFQIGSGTTKTAGKSGYFYCFANDVWRFYFNNTGNIRLTVERLA